VVNRRLYVPLIANSTGLASSCSALALGVVIEW
jgi:hypothetical protein